MGILLGMMKLLILKKVLVSKKATMIMLSIPIHMMKAD